MRTPIFKDEHEAELNAKIQAIRAFESAESIQVNDDLFVNSESLWLIKSNTTSCACGETSSVEVVLFPKYITTEFDTDKLSVDSDEDQYYGKAGICDSCGE